MNADTAVNGRQVELTHGSYTATVSEVGATLRALSYDGRPLILGFDGDEIRPAARGAILAPWPNRIEDGRYSFNGTDYELPLTEPANHNAIHGLVMWASWTVESQTTSSVILRHSLVPQPGYPFPLDLVARYALDDDGLHWSLTATNTGTSAAPYGCGIHPYLVPGPGPVDDWTLSVPATDYLDVTDERYLPTVMVDGAGTAYDFRNPRLVGSTVLNVGYTNIIANSGGGLAQVDVRDDSGQGIAIRWDPSVSPWVLVYTYDRPGSAEHRTGLAVEPMTCPVDAFNSGTDLVTLQPGESHLAGWAIAALTNT